MGKYTENGLLQDTWIIYSRKSRQDDPNETIEEVLAKHEAILQEYAERELGGRIPEKNIYREVVSGESIEDRDAIKEVLARIEDKEVRGVLVVEPQRLSRGDLEDCGRLINDFRYTHTLVVTPMMTYDLENKMERKFFQDELLRGRDYLEYTKEILFRGRIAAVKRGCYVSAVPPFGYNRIKIGKDWTLEPNDDADAVRLAFDWFVREGVSAGRIAKRLDDLGYRSAHGEKWSRYSIRGMLLNVHYIGKVRYNTARTTWVIEQGERVKKRIKQADEDVIIAEGKHPAIIDADLFEQSVKMWSANPRTKLDHELKNMYAGVLRCKKCGRTMQLDQKLTKAHNLPRYLCQKKPGCYKSAKAEEVHNAILFALENVSLPDLQAKIKNGDGDAANIQKRRIEKLVKQMEEYREQEDKQYELLETKKYTQELFDRRNAILRGKMETCEKELRTARANMPKNVDYAERLTRLEEAIAALRDPEMEKIEKNRILRSIVERIDYSATDLGVNKTDIHLDVVLRLQ